MILFLPGKSFIQNFYPQHMKLCKIDAIYLKKVKKDMTFLLKLMWQKYKDKNSHLFKTQ